MTSPTTPLIAYATPENNPGRFGHLKVFFFFIPGLLLGYVIATAIQLAAPDFAAGSQGARATMVTAAFALPMLLALMSAYSVITLLLIGHFSTRARIARPFWFCALVGIGIPALIAIMRVTGHVAAVVTSPPPWLEWTGIAVVSALSAISVLGGPFLLVWRKAALSATDRPRAPLRSRLTKIILIVISVCALFSLGLWAAEKQYDRDCEKLAAWVKTAHPTPGNYPALPLPPSQRLLADNGVVDVVVLSDGQVALMLQSSSGWKGNWSGILYTTRPLKPAEIGDDGYGRMQITGFPSHFVEAQEDSQHYVVGFDLN